MSDMKRRQWSIVKAKKDRERKHLLTELSFEVIGSYFPRIARVDIKSGQVEFIRDTEKLVEECFTLYDWEKFLCAFLQNICPDEYEKCKTFFSLENLRRIYDRTEEGAACTYRRIYQGEYIWFQAVIIPVKQKQLENSVLIYARMLDENIKADEMYKEQLWQQVQDEKREGREKDDFLKYLSGNLRIPMDAVTEMSRMALDALINGDQAQAERCMRIVDRLNMYFAAMLGDVMQVGVMRDKKVISRKTLVSPAVILDGIKMYYENETAGIKVKISVDEKIQETYFVDQSRLIQTLNSLMAPLYECGENCGDILLQVEVTERKETFDYVTISARRERGPLSDEFIDEVRASFPDNDKECAITPVVMALQALGGSVHVDKNIPANNFALTFVSEYVPDNGGENS